MPPPQTENRDWTKLLRRLNELLFAVLDEQAELGEEDLGYLAAQPNPRWLGAPPASARVIASAEARLGVSFPSAYRRFLAASDGWLAADGFPRLGVSLHDSTHVRWVSDDSSREPRGLRDYIAANPDLLVPPAQPDEELLDRLLCVGDGAGSACILLVVSARDDDWPVLTWDPENGFSRGPGIEDLFERELAYRESQSPG